MHLKAVVLILLRIWSLIYSGAGTVSASSVQYLEAAPPAGFLFGIVGRFRSESHSLRVGLVCRVGLVHTKHIPSGGNETVTFTPKVYLLHCKPN